MNRSIIILLVIIYLFTCNVSALAGRGGVGWGGGELPYRWYLSSYHTLGDGVYVEGGTRVVTFLGLRLFWALAVYALRSLEY